MSGSEGRDRGATPSQTVGPFFRFGLEWMRAGDVAQPGSDAALTLQGTVHDGDGLPVPDAMVEVWQADPRGRFGEQAGPGWTGFARCLTDDGGRYRCTTVKPGPVAADDGTLQAPHIDLSVFARGLLQRLVTRVYFPDEAEPNRADPVLASIEDPAARESLVAIPVDGGIRFDIHLQGDRETTFFAY